MFRQWGDRPPAAEFGIRRPDGPARIIHLQGEPLANEPGSPAGYVGTLQDVTAQRASENRLVRLANIDPLTELPNRNLFKDRLLHAMSQARR